MRTVSPSEVPDVQAYLEAEEALNYFMSTKEPVITALRALIEDANAKRQVADKTVKALGVFCGPWQKHRSNFEIDADKLVDIIGVEQFTAIGGVTETKYKLDDAKFRLAEASKVLPEGIAKDVRRLKVAYSAPKDRAL